MNKLLYSLVWFINWFNSFYEPVSMKWIYTWIIPKQIELARPATPGQNFSVESTEYQNSLKC